MKLGEWIGLLCLAIALVLLWQIRQMLLLVFTAVVLATAINSLVRRIQKFGIRRGLAILIAMIGLALVGGIFVQVIVPPFTEQFLSLLELLPKGFQQITNWLDAVIQNNPELFAEQLEFSSISNLAQQIQPLIQNILSNFFALFSNSLAVVFQFLVVIVITLMLLANPLPYRQAVIQIFPSFYRRRVDTILVECESALGNWFGGIVISSVSVGLLSGLGLLVLGIRLVLAHALLAGLLNFIPNIGPTLSLIFPLTIALIDAPWKAIPVIILYIVIQNIESYWLTPTVMAKQVSLLPAMTLIAQIFFAATFGFLGLLLALPLTVVVKVFIEEALIRDVMDRWKSDQYPDLAIATLPNPIMNNRTPADDPSAWLSSAVALDSVHGPTAEDAHPHAIAPEPSLTTDPSTPSDPFEPESSP
ncbi:MAG: AI-2E family transporter [Synechococcales cyanobacterium K44_A2020_017]|nr:AI-2E family transporter [Synechococcales cyanobacterium K32_A2020_035]MBF2096058.1 AI-2E family transporter [Synechococcales cyanobacterium K44_A2020_017]